MSNHLNEKIYSFDNFQLDVSRKLLMRLPEREVVALTHKAFEVLLLLIENKGALVTKDEMMTKVWEGSFVEEANLTQTISVLRKTLGENPNQHRFIVTESGKGYRFVAQLKESDQEALTKYANLSENEISGNGYEEKTVRQKSDSLKPYFITFGAIVIVFFIGVYYFWNRHEKQDSRLSTAKDVKSIAVLPFRNVESDKANRLLGIGMADAVITKLSHVKSIVVRQTNTVIRYADSTPEAIRIGRDINVDAILEGNIQQADGRIRVSVRLFRVNDGALLWAESFDERDTDIFALQDSISDKVANSLSLELNPEERQNFKRRYTKNIEAYHLYNKGRFFWNNRSSEDLRKSIAMYEQAIAKDENYAPAYAGLAESYVLLHLFSQSREKDLFPKAKIAAEKALSLDMNLAEAHTALALYKEQYEWNWEGAESEFKLAINANPNYATAYQWYGEFLAFMGRTDESIVQVKKALELDPLSLSTNTAQAFPFIAAERWDEALENLKPALDLDENFAFALFYLARCYDGKGLYKEAIVGYRKAIAAAGGSAFFTSSLINVLNKNGQRAEAQKALDDLLKVAQSESISRYVLARSFAALGNKNRALDELETAFQERDSLMIIVKLDQNFFPMYSETRFQDILKKMRL